MTKINKQQGSIKIAVFVVVAAVLLLSLGYFFLWRPSDSDYRVAETDVAKLRSVANKTRAGLKIIEYPGFIDDKTVTALGDIVEDYKKASGSLAKSAVVGRDFAVSTVYGQYKDEVAGYGDALEDLGRSITVYLAIVETCDSIESQFGGINTVDDFDAAAENCKTALASGSSVPSKTFYDRFLSDYISYANQLLTSYRNAVSSSSDDASISAARKAIDAAKKKIVNIGSKKIDYSLPDPSETLDKLASVISSQKTAFWR